MAPVLGAIIVFFAGNCFALGSGLRVLYGHVPKVVNGLAPKAKLAETNQIRLAIGVSMRDPAGLKDFVAEISDPASPNFRDFLTREQLMSRFGPTEQDYAAVRNFAATNGLAIAAIHSNRLLLDVTGPVSAIEKAFHVTLWTYRDSAEGRDFFAPAAEPMVDSSLRVADVEGLTDYWRPHPRLLKHGTSHAVPRKAANGTAPDGSGDLFGDDFRTAYAPGTSLTGAGQSVGLLEFDGYFTNDIALYASEARGGRTNIAVTTVLLDGYNGKPSTGINGGEGEVELDIEMAMAIAPGLSQIVSYEVGESGNPNDVLNAMLSNSNVVNLSCSWGWNGGPSTTTDAIFESMDAVGQTFFNASGDSGAFTTGSNSVNGVDNVSLDNVPSSDPFIMQVGGATLSLNAAGTSWSSEVVWTYSSGGISSFYPIPAWQTNVSNMTGRGGSATFRNVPDVAADANNVYEIYNNNDTNAADDNQGTSCAAPLWAGFTALVNQQSAASGGPPVGFINPALYAIAARSNYLSCFHDIIKGSNTWSKSPNLFYATNNYDLCTGLGAMGGTNLINALVSMAAIQGAPQIYRNLQPQYLVFEGQPVSLPVTAYGTVPLSYQWLSDTNTIVRNNYQISGAGTNTLTISPAQLSNVGTYQCIITNDYGSVTSSIATLIVIGVPVNFNSNGVSANGAGWTATQSGTFTSAEITNGVLELTDNGRSEARSFFFDYPQYIGAFAASFVYQIGGNAAADGMSFCIQNDPRSPGALGTGGGYFGVGSTGNITPSWELEFNMNSSGADGTGYNAFTNGNIGANVAIPGISLSGGDSGHPIGVSLYYLNGQMTLAFTDYVSKASWVTNFAANIPAAVGGQTAYVGFTGGDGAKYSTQTITEFSFISIPTVQIQPNSPNAIITWPGGIPGYTLQENSSLTKPNNWVNAPNPAILTNGLYQVTVPIAGANEFYRLIGP